MYRSNPAPIALIAFLLMPIEPAAVLVQSSTGGAAEPAAAPAQPRRVKRATVAVTLDSSNAGMISNQASVSASTPEGRAGDESITEKTTVTSRADLSLTIADGQDPAIAGGPLSYVVTVNNAGPSDARYVEVTATPSSGVTIVGSRGCTEDPTGVPLCSLGTIPAGSSKSFTLEAMVSSGAIGETKQQASVSSQTAEAKPGDESAEEATALDTRADLGIAVTDSIDPIIDGRTMSYAVVVTNAGPSDAQGVTVSDILPAGVTFASTTGCAEDPGPSAVCTLGTIAAGASKSYSLAVTVNRGTVGHVTNQATVSAKTAEAKPGNEATQEATLVEMKSELQLTSSDSADPVIAGTSLTYTIKVANAGPSDALGVVVEDTLPPGVTFASTSGCAEDPAGVPTCTLETIPAGTAKQFLIVMTVNPDRTGKIANQAKVATKTSLPGSSIVSISEETRIDTQADLVISTRDSVDPVIAGSALTYTITVANKGPSDARDVLVAGALPEGVTFQATSGCGEDSKPGGGIPNCTLGMIPASSSKQYTISVMVRPDATGVITNQAAVSSSTREGRPGDEATPNRMK